MTIIRPFQLCALLRRPLLILAVCFIAIGSRAQIPIPDPGPPVPIGEQIPIITGLNLKGEDVTLLDYRGKVVLIEFWATWCGPCLNDLPTYRRLYRDYHDKGFEILSISVDESAEDLIAFCTNEKTAIPWTVLHDGAGLLGPAAQALGIHAIPRTFLIDRDGKLVSYNERGRGIVEAVARMTDPDGPQPPEYDKFLEKYETAAPEERAAMRAAGLRFAPMLGRDILLGFLAHSLKGQPSPETVRVAREIVAEVRTAEADVSIFTLSSLLAYYEGDCQTAVKEESQLIAEIAGEERARYKAGGNTSLDEKDDAEIFFNSSHAEGDIVRMALYEACAGNRSRARELLKLVPNANDQFARKAREVIAANP